MEDESPTNLGWYISDRHCNRAIGYLTAWLVEKGHLQDDFEMPIMLELWGQSLAATMDVNEPSPIGPSPELAKQILESEHGATTTPSTGAGAAE